MDTTRSSPLRVAVWVLHMALPMAILAVLLAFPRLDLRWQNDPAHFWLVMAVAAVNAALGFRMSEEARLRRDARLFLVGLAFLAAAGFLALHALATPSVLVEGGSLGFNVAMPAGLVLASVLVAASSLDLSPERAAAIMRRQNLLRYGLGALMITWAFLSLYELPPLNAPLGTDEILGPLAVATVAAVALYAVAAFRYHRLHRQRPAVLLLGLVTAFVLLGEAMVNVTVARNWQLSWWLWHVLVGAAFGYLAYAAHIHYRREGASSGLFAAISLEETLRQIRREYGAALESLVEAIGRPSSDQPLETALRQVTAEFDLTEGQGEVLRRAAQALAAERGQTRRLRALAAIGRRAEVLSDEQELLRRAIAELAPAFGEDRIRIGLRADGETRFPAELDSRPGEGEVGELLELPLQVEGEPAGILQVRRPHGSFEEPDRVLLESLAGQISVSLENVRLYRRVEGLFRRYLSPDVASALLAEGRRTGLGSERREITVLFADLRGFTSFAEDRPPGEVVDVLNRYLDASVPIILERGGTIDKFMGDAVMAIFNAPAAQPNHALQAVETALALQETVEGISTSRPDWPRFRIGVNTGPALVGEIGSRDLRNYTAIGDAVNLASRLQGVAGPGEVVLGPTTYALVRDLAVVEPLGSLEVKGKREPVPAYRLLGLREEG